MIDKEERLRAIQQEIDVEKWLASEQAGRDLCGEATYCTYCDKTLTDPCARSLLTEQAEKAAEGREVADKSEAKEEVETSIAGKAVEVTVEVARPGYEQVTRYRRSLKSKLIQNEAAQGYYNALKNEFLGYDGVRSRISFNYETFRKGKKLLAKFLISGKTLSVYLALSPEEFEERDRMCRRMAEWLVGCGIDPEAETRIGRKAIDFAVENRIKLTSAFLAGDDDTVSGGMDLHQAVTVDDADAVSAILSAGADPDALCDRPGDYLGMTPLMVACRRMARASAESLIEGGASAAYTDGRDGRTALYHLLRSLSSTVGTGSNARDSGSFLSMLRMVADAQGTPDLPVGDEEGSALCFLAGNDGLGHTSDGRSVRGIAFDTLVSMGADVDARDRHGRTPLILACGIPGPESEGIVSTLMELGADCDASDEDGTTAIMRAASIPGNAGIDLIRAMLDFCVPDLGLRDSMGRDALELASDAGNADVVRLLLSLRGGSPSALGTGRQEHLDDLGEPGLRRIMHRGASVIVGGVGVRPALEEQRDEVVASVAGGQD